MTSEQFVWWLKGYMNQYSKSEYNLESKEELQECLFDFTGRINEIYEKLITVI